MTRQPFAADRFTATPHSTAAEKAQFCATFTRFVLGGFPRGMFKSAFYRRLSNIFGHIAHYDVGGFWEVWFADPAKQRQFVQNIHQYVPLGDPRFCWVDVERELKSWAVMNAAAIDAVLSESERSFAEAAEAETDRRAALVGKTCQRFTVVAKSSNLGAFGHRQYIMCAQDGSTWKVQRIYLYAWAMGQVVNVPLLNGEPDWCRIQGVECPERVANCPLDIVAEVTKACPA